MAGAGEALARKRTPARIDGDRYVTTAATSGERLLLSIVRDLFEIVLSRQPFDSGGETSVRESLTRGWTVQECQSIRWWILQTCLTGTLFPELPQ
jgi:hypothetical protein